MSLTQWTTAIQNQAALSVYGRPYADLLANEKVFLDNTASAPTATPGGRAGHALANVFQYAQWYEQAGAASAPDAWEHVLIAEVKALMMPRVLPAEAPMAYKELAKAWQSAADSFSAVALSVSTLQQQTVTYQTVRYHVINHCIRLGKRFYVPVAVIDANTLWVIRFLWNSHRWNFRRRHTVATIAAAGTVTFDLPTGETFRSVATGRSNATMGGSFFYTDATGDELAWADASDMARLKAGATNTGKPQVYRTEHRVAGLTWLFYPAPDAEYTVRGEVVIDVPTAVTTPTDSTAFDKFPVEFKTIIPDLVLGKVLRDNGRGDDLWRSAFSQVEALLPLYDDRGTVEQGRESSDVYGMDWVGGPTI